MLTPRTFCHFTTLSLKNQHSLNNNVFQGNTCILAGLRTSNEADALKDKDAKGLDNVVEFIMVKLLVSIV